MIFPMVVRAFVAFVSWGRSHSTNSYLVGSLITKSQLELEVPPQRMVAPTSLGWRPSSVHVWNPGSGKWSALRIASMIRTPLLAVASQLISHSLQET